LRFDDDLSHYGTKNGVLPNNDALVALSSPQMWAVALDRLLGILAEKGDFSISEIRAISGSGQQHGSVYLNAQAESALAGLDPKKPLLFTLSTFVKWRLQ
jgi:xylulokinase